MKGPSNENNKNLLDQDFLDLIETNKHWQICLQEKEKKFHTQPYDNFDTK